MPKGIKPKTAMTIDSELMMRLAEKRFKSGNVSELAKEMNISRDSIVRIMRHPKFQDLMLHELRYRVGQLYGLAVIALEKQLADGNMDAIKTVFKTAGLLEPHEEKKGDAQITVVLPGAHMQAPAIEVRNEPKVQEEEAEDPGSGMCAVQEAPL